MITITVGTGGDYTDLLTAINSISWATLGHKLTDDYTIDIISDCTADATVASIQVGTDYTLRITSSYNEARPDDWQNWYKIRLTGTVTRSLDLNISTPSFPTDGTLIFDYFYVVNERTASQSGWACVTALNASGKTYVQNGYVNGNVGSTGVTYGISIGNTGSTGVITVLQNLKIWDCAVCLRLAYDLANTGHRVTCENISLLCKDQVTTAIFLIDQLCTLRNVVAMGSGVGAASVCYKRDSNIGVTVCLSENCASSDASVLTVVPNATGYIHSVVPATEFVSLDDTNANFLKFANDGHKKLAASAEPVRGQAPLTCQFTPDVDFDYGSMGALAYSGAAPTYATTDIEGNARPGDDDLYSIGCHEAQFETRIR